MRVEDELPAGVVGVGDSRERAVDDDDGVHAAVAPVRKHVVRLGRAHRRRGGDVGLPLAAEPGLAVDVRGLGREPDDREGVGSTAVRAHLHEQRRRAAHGAELSSLGAGRRRGGGSGGVGGGGRGSRGGLLGVDGEPAGERGAGGGLRARRREWGSEDGVVGAELPGGGEEREHGERGEEGLEVEAEQRGRRTRRNAGGGSVLPHRCVRVATARRAEPGTESSGGGLHEVFHWWVAD